MTVMLRVTMVVVGEGGWLGTGHLIATQANNTINTIDSGGSTKLDPKKVTPK